MFSFLNRNRKQRKLERRPTNLNRLRWYRPRLELLEDRTLPSAGLLDPTFGVGGRVDTDFSSSTDQALAVAQQSDGKIILAGSTQTSAGSDFALARYNADGSLDTSFGNQGKVTTDSGSQDDVGRAVAIQSDGKIVVAGFTRCAESSCDFALVRYNADGSLDSSFGSGGIVITDFGNGSIDRALGVAIQGDGKIVAVGHSSNSLTVDFNFAVARYNEDGSLDGTFGASESGTLITDFGTIDDEAYGVALQADGKIVAVGFASGVEVTSSDFALARYNANGSLDTSFGTGGRVTTNFAGSQDLAFSVILQPDGKIVAGGEAQETTFDFALARYNSDGSLDASFGPAGLITADFPDGNVDAVTSLALQPDGKIVAAGESMTDHGLDFALTRFESDGSQSNDFGTEGTVTTDFHGLSDRGSGVILQADGKIIVGGTTWSSDEEISSNFALSRYGVASGEADVALIATASPNPVAFGHTLTYFLAATNFGPDLATGVTLTDTLPSGVALVSAVGSQGSYTQSGNQLTFALGDLAPRASATAVITVTVTATTTGTLVNTASVTANETDPDTSNNAAQLDTPELFSGTLQFSAPTYQVSEGGRSAVITVERSGGSYGIVTVDFTTSDGMAIAGLRGDYLKATGTLTFDDGETSKTIAVRINNDAAIESNETVNLTLRNPTGGAILGPPAAAVLTIIDNDPEISFASARSNQREGFSLVTLPVTLSGRSTKTVTIDYAVVGGTATRGVDYRFANGQLVFRPGQTSKTIIFSIIDDSQFDPNETVIIQLSNPVNGSLGTPSTNTVTILDDEAPPDPAGDTQATALPVDLLTAPRQILKNSLSKTDSDMYRVDLHQGDFLAIDVDPNLQSGFPLPGSSLVITAPDGTKQQIGASREPDTGVTTPNPAFLLHATMPGTYYLLLRTGTPRAAGYTLELHRLALAEGPQDPQALQQTGPMYTFLQGDTLYFTGPTGYGFAITGNWKQTITTTAAPTKPPSRLTASIYTATGTPNLQTALGTLPLNVPTGKVFTVTTKPGVWGATFGEVKSMKTNVALVLGDYTKEFVAALAFLGHPDFALAADQSIWTIELGSRIRQQRAIEQVLDGVPYLTYGEPVSGHVEFANRSFDLKLGAVTSKPFVALDPTDPMFYFGAPAMNFGFAASPNGRIPYVPVREPTAPGAGNLVNFFGHVFASYSFEFKAAGIPLSLDADITVNLDANRDGQILAGQGAAAGALLFVGGPVAVNALAPILPDLAIGANGELNLGLGELVKQKYHLHEDLPLPFDLKIGDASLVFNGPQNGFWVSAHTGVDNPLANTPFEDLVPDPQTTFEAAIFGDGRFFVSFAGKQSITAGHLTFAITLDNSGITAEVGGKVGWSSNGLSATASLTGTLTLTFDPSTGKLHYHGGVHASGKIKGFGVNLGFDVGADIEDCTLVFDLPLIGRRKVELPC